MPDWWYRLLTWCCARGYYQRVRLIRDVPAPTGGAVLYALLHRNGAVDGMIYLTTLGPLTFLVAAQLLRSRFSRLFFTGIPVVRRKDGGDRSINTGSLDQCVTLLRGEGRLGILPEGTSDLGPAPLPFEPGVARIAAEALAAGVPLTILPAGIYYTAAPRFRSDVIVRVGPAVATELPFEASPEARRDILMSRISQALHALAVHTSSREELARAECLAALAVDGSLDRYPHMLLDLAARPMPNPIELAWQRVQGALQAGNLLAIFGVPALSKRGRVWSLAWMAAQFPFVVLAAVINAPVLLGSRLAARRYADAPNTIALWRLLSGIPLAVGWWTLLAITAIASGHGVLLALALGITLAGLYLWPEFQARRVRWHNAAASEEVKKDLHDLTVWARGRATAER